MNLSIRRTKRWIAAAIASLVCVAFAVQASATVMIYLDLGGLVEHSDVIVHGKVVDQQTLIDEQRDQVVTRTTLEVETTYLGDERETVTFQQWGGEWEGVLRKIPGDPDFEPYEEVVLFLNAGEGEYEGLYLTAMSQSVYTVRRDGDQPRVYRDLRDIGLVKDESAIDIMHADLERNTFASFEAELMSLIAGIKGGKQ